VRRAFQGTDKKDFSWKLMSLEKKRSGQWFKGIFAQVFLIIQFKIEKNLKATYAWNMEIE